MSQPNLKNIQDVAIYVWEFSTVNYAVNIIKIPKFFEKIDSNYFQGYFPIVPLTIAAIPAINDYSRNASFFKIICANSYLPLLSRNS
jgi:hypothetical protein